MVARVTVPEKPLALAIVIVDSPVALAAIVKELGAADIRKSGVPDMCGIIFPRAAFDPQKRRPPDSNNTPRTERDFETVQFFKMLPNQSDGTRSVLTVSSRTISTVSIQFRVPFWETRPDCKDPPDTESARCLRAS